MGTFNTLVVDLQCPRCGVTAEMEAELKFGNTAQMQRLHLGDAYPWSLRGAVQNGGRPVDGSCDGDGYVECPRCCKDFFVSVLIRHDIIESVDIDHHRPGYIPD